VNRAFVADATALILFFTTTGIINERFIAGMAWEQVFHARLLWSVMARWSARSVLPCHRRWTTP